MTGWTNRRLKRHGFTNGLWRLEQRALLAKQAREDLKREQIATRLSELILTAETDADFAEIERLETKLIT